MRRIRTRLTYANVMATIAVFIALGGSSFAALALKKNQVKARNIAPNAVRSAKVKDQSLLARDFKAGELPQGAQGLQGERGPQGEQGAAGSPDTGQQVLDKLKTVDGSSSGLDADLLQGQSSSAFLGATAKAADADRLDNIDSAEFIRGGAGRMLANRLVFDPADPALSASPRPVLLNVPFMGQLKVNGCNGTVGSVNFDTVGNGDVYEFNDLSGTGTNTAPVITSNYFTSSLPKAQFTMSVAKSTGTSTRMATMWIAFNGDDCTFQAQGLMLGTG